jgi:hypothetical protein
LDESRASGGIERDAALRAGLLQRERGQLVEVAVRLAPAW